MVLNDISLLLVVFLYVLAKSWIVLIYSHEWSILVLDSVPPIPDTDTNTRYRYQKKISVCGISIGMNLDIGIDIGLRKILISVSVLV